MCSKICNRACSLCWHAVVVRFGLAHFSWCACDLCVSSSGLLWFMGNEWDMGISIMSVYCERRALGMTCCAVSPFMSEFYKLFLFLFFFFCWGGG